MKRTILAGMALCLALGLLATDAFPGGRDDREGDGVQIVITPKMLVLSAPTTWVTVHTNIPLGLVDCDSLELSGVSVDWTKADNRGNLVAKIAVEGVAEIVAPPSATLTLSGLLADGTPFAASDTISVKE